MFHSAASMDLDTARKLRHKLQLELNAFRDFGHFHVLPRVVDFEIFRLLQDIGGEESRRNFGYNSEDKIAIENPLMIVNLSNQFVLRDEQSLVGFKRQLINELHVLMMKFHRPLPVTFQFIKRVNERFEDEVYLRTYATLLHRDAIEQLPPALKPPPMPIRSRVDSEYLDNCIYIAIQIVLENDPEGATSNQVLEILRNFAAIAKIDYYDISLVRQRFYEATFPHHSTGHPRL